MEKKLKKNEVGMMILSIEQSVALLLTHADAYQAGTIGRAELAQRFEAVACNLRDEAQQGVFGPGPSPFPPWPEPGVMTTTQAVSVPGPDGAPMLVPRRLAQPTE